MDRRTLNASLAGSVLLALTRPALAAARKRRAVVYTGAGTTLTHYDLDAAAATLVRRGSISLPSTIQYAWPHRGGRYLYATTSDSPGGSRTITGTKHRLLAYRIGADGALALHGEPQVLRQRPVHNSVDNSGRFALTAYNIEGEVTVHAINRDGTLGAAVDQVRAGIFTHQVTAMPGNRSIVAVGRGYNATADKPEESGALMLFRLGRDGKLAPLQTIAVGGGANYGPRHLDYHPNGRWVYVALERQNRLHMHRIDGEGFVAEPDFNVSTTEQAIRGVHQVLGPVHVHPNGRTVYTANRSSGTADFRGVKVLDGRGDNSIAVFRIDPNTGEPALIQKVETHGIHARTFTIDPSGTLLIAATMAEMLVREGEAVRTEPAGLSLYRIGPDGTLNFVRKYDVPLAAGETQVWVRAMALPSQG